MPNRKIRPTSTVSLNESLKSEILRRVRNNNQHQRQNQDRRRRVKIKSSFSFPNDTNGTPRNITSKTRSSVRSRSKTRDDMVKGNKAEPEHVARKCRDVVAERYSSETADALQTSDKTVKRRLRSSNFAPQTLLVSSSVEISDSIRNEPEEHDNPDMCKQTQTSPLPERMQSPRYVSDSPCRLMIAERSPMSYRNMATSVFRLTDNMPTSPLVSSRGHKEKRKSKVTKVKKRRSGSKLSAKDASKTQTPQECNSNKDCVPAKPKGRKRRKMAQKDEADYCLKPLLQLMNKPSPLAPLSSPGSNDASEDRSDPLVRQMIRKRIEQRLAAQVEQKSDEPLQMVASTGQPPMRNISTQITTDGREQKATPSLDDDDSCSTITVTRTAAAEAAKAAAGISLLPHFENRQPEIAPSEPVEPTSENITIQVRITSAPDGDPSIEASASAVDTCMGGAMDTNQVKIGQMMEGPVRSEPLSQQQENGNPVMTLNNLFHMIPQESQAMETSSTTSLPPSLQPVFVLAPSSQPSGMQGVDTLLNRGAEQTLIPLGQVKVHDQSTCLPAGMTMSTSHGQQQQLIKVPMSTSKTPSPESSVPKENNPSLDAKGEKIKRPMNAFMIWSRDQRAVLLRQTPKMTNAEISIKLGHMWNDLDYEMKQKFFDEANKLKEQHKKDYPGWMYQPRPQRRRRRQLAPYYMGQSPATRLLLVLPDGQQVVCPAIPGPPMNGQAFPTPVATGHFAPGPAVPNSSISGQVMMGKGEPDGAMPGGVVSGSMGGGQAFPGSQGFAGGQAFPTHHPMSNHQSVQTQGALGQTVTCPVVSGSVMSSAEAPSQASVPGSVAFGKPMTCAAESSQPLPNSHIVEAQVMSSQAMQGCEAPGPVMTVASPSSQTSAVPCETSQWVPCQALPGNIISAQANPSPVVASLSSQTSAVPCETSQWVPRQALPGDIIFTQANPSPVVASPSSQTSAFPCETSQWVPRQALPSNIISAQANPSPVVPFQTISTPMVSGQNDKGSSVQAQTESGSTLQPQYNGVLANIGTKQQFPHSQGGSNKPAMVEPRQPQDGTMCPTLLESLLKAVAPPGWAPDTAKGNQVPSTASAVATTIMPNSKASASDGAAPPVGMKAQYANAATYVMSAHNVNSQQEIVNTIPIHQALPSEAVKQASSQLKDQSSQGVVVGGTDAAQVGMAIRMVQIPTLQREGTDQSARPTRDEASMVSSNTNPSNLDVSVQAPRPGSTGHGQSQNGNIPVALQAEWQQGPFTLIPIDLGGATLQVQPMREDGKSVPMAKPFHEDNSVSRSKPAQPSGAGSSSRMVPVDLPSSVLKPTPAESAWKTQSLVTRPFQNASSLSSSTSSQPQPVNMFPFYFTPVDAEGNIGQGVTIQPNLSEPASVNSSEIATESKVNRSVPTEPQHSGNAPTFCAINAPEQLLESLVMSGVDIGDQESDGLFERVMGIE